MIYYDDSSEKSKNALFQSLKKLKAAGLLRQAGIRKACGVSAYEVFKFLILLVFQSKNLYGFLNSKKSDMAVSKNTYYRFINESTYAWRKFLSLLAIKVIGAFHRLTRPERVNTLILDDTMVTRNRSKCVELMAKVYDHATHRYQKGFTMLTLGSSDGYSFVPVDFAMLSSTNKTNRLQDCAATVDKRSHGYKRRQEALQKKPEVAINMIKCALQQGVMADYVLMDTWFTHEPLIQSIIEEGLHVIGMVKQLKQKYTYQGNDYTLKELRTLLQKNTIGNILGSVTVRTKQDIPVKIVYVKNRNNKRQWLTILSTDITLSNEEIIRIYGNRWSIELFFKAIKSFLKLGIEFQGRSYDMMISHTTIVFTRYILLEWIKREEKDTKTFGELFFNYCDDISDMDLESALQSLMSLLVEQIKGVSSKYTSTIKNQLQYWIDQQASYIKGLFANLSWES